MAGEKSVAKQAIVQWAGNKIKIGNEAALISIGMEDLKDALESRPKKVNIVKRITNAIFGSRTLWSDIDPLYNDLLGSKTIEKHTGAKQILSPLGALAIGKAA